MKRLRLFILGGIFLFAGSKTLFAQWTVALLGVRELVTTPVAAPAPSPRDRLNKNFRFEVKATGRHAFRTENMDKTIVLSPVVEGDQLVAVSASVTADGRTTTGRLTVADDGTGSTDTPALIPAANVIGLPKSVVETLKDSDETVTRTGKFEVRGSAKDVTSSIRRISKKGETPVKLRGTITSKDRKINLVAENTYDADGIPTASTMTGTVVSTLTVTVRMSMTRTEPR